MRLVNTLLDFSRIEAGRIRAFYQPSDLSQLTTDIGSVFRSAIEKAGLEFTIECASPSEPIYVDHEMWEKIVLNLLSNAFKFTLDGFIRINLAHAGERAILRVSDSGAGIPANDIGRIFDRFHRVDGARGRTHEGSGIGLAFVHELVKLHGGEVHVESQLGVGSTFTVEIPSGKAHLPAEQIGSARNGSSGHPIADTFLHEAVHWLPAESDIGQPTFVGQLDSLSSERITRHPAGRILVVDDNADSAAIGKLLQLEAHELRCAFDGASAIAIAQQFGPRLVL